MIETLNNLFGNLPVVGEPIKMAYLGSRVKEAVQKTKDSKLDADTANLAGNKLDEQLRNKADEIYDQNIAEHVAKAGLPAFANVATLTFSRSTNTANLVWILTDIGLSVTSNMAAITGSSYVSHTHIIHTSVVQFVGLDNQDRVITISMQCCIIC